MVDKTMNRKSQHMYQYFYHYLRLNLPTKNIIAMLERIKLVQGSDTADNGLLEIIPSVISMP
jgi:hypothetical protein